MSDAVFAIIDISGEPELLQRCAAAHFATGSFDYNTVVPMPPELDIVEGSAVTTGYDALYGDWTEPAKYWTWKDAAEALGLPFPLQSREELLACIRSLECAGMYLDPARQYKENIDKFGHGSWFGWCKQHWGTKSNAEDSSVATGTDHIVVKFTAVNSFPKPVLKSLSRGWAELNFSVLYVDEHERWGRAFCMRNGREISKTKLTPKELTVLWRQGRAEA